ncbi:MAG: DNA-processing protein DprA [Candidatus Aenigmatarchaeota archaeon]
MVKKSSILLNLAKISLPKVSQLLSLIKDLDVLLDMKLNNFKEFPFLNDKDIKEILKVRDSGLLDEELKLVEKENIKVIDIFDKNYPLILKEISFPPLVLYIKGEPEVLNSFNFAIVGTRLASMYGLMMAEEFAYKLASFGLVIVSGLAKGIDTSAHKGAIKKGKTIAVLGSGILNLYPKENRKLAEDIIKSGAIISEFNLREPPFKENFPRRNRIISGLSKGVLVIEAALKSGALITARLALEQNREVFALPGRADSPLSKGTHLLIKEGAKLVENIEDILDELNIKFDRVLEEDILKLDPKEKLLLNFISKDGISLEELILKSNLEPSVVSKLILNLELKGVVREVRPSYFIKVR